ncbi:MAG: hypothetical protein NXI07_13585 [bacterium]|nr:hypothetical protein [bacterium]
MMITSIIGAATLALGPCNANGCGSSQITTPRVIEINPDMFDTTAVNRRQIRFSQETRGEVVGIRSRDGQVTWESDSDREFLGGQNGPSLIYIQIFDGTFAIDPFVPIPNATDATAQQLFRGTSLETDRAQFGRQRIDRTKELFRKLEQARVNWLRDNGYYGVRSFTNPKAGEKKEAKLPEPAATFRRPADMPRTKPREQVNANPGLMGSIAFLMNAGETPVRVSLPAHLDTSSRVSVIQRNGADAKEEVASKE